MKHLFISSIISSILLADISIGFYDKSIGLYISEPIGYKNINLEYSPSREFDKKFTKHIVVEERSFVNTKNKCGCPIRKEVIQISTLDQSYKEDITTARLGVNYGGFILPYNLKAIPSIGIGINDEYTNIFGYGSAKLQYNYNNIVISTGWFIDYSQGGNTKDGLLFQIGYKI